MSLISFSNISDGSTIDASDVNTPFNTIYNDYNGGITAANLASNAITTVKITDANITPAKWTNPYKFRAYLVSAFTTNAGTPKLIPFDTKSFDTNTNFDIVTNKGRYTAPVSGYYFFTAHSELGASSTSRAIMTIYKNGGEIERGNDIRVASTNKGVTVTAFAQLSASDYVEAFIETDAAVGVDVTNPAQNSFAGFLVSQT